MKRMMAMIAAVALGGVVLAQDGGGKGGEGGKAPPKAAAGLNFMQIDANGDGQLTKVEWLACFARLDTNKDGLISADEAAVAPAPGKAKEGDGAGKKGGEGDGKRNGKGEGK